MKAACQVVLWRQTNRQTDTTERPTHTGGYASMGNECHQNK